MMKFHTLAAIAAISVASMAMPAQATVLSSKLSFDGIPDKIEDNSVSQIFPHDGNIDRPFQVGDKVIGLLNFEDIDGNDVGGGELIISIFAFEIVAFHPNYIELGAIPADDPLSIQSLLDDALEPTLEVGTWDNVIGAVVSTTSAADPFADTVSDPVDIIQSMTAAAGWELELIDGIVDGDDFFHARSVAPSTITTIEDIRDDDSGAMVLVDRAALTIQATGWGTGVEFIPLPITGLDGVDAYGDIIINPDGAVQTSSGMVPNWDLENDTNFLMNPVPEPGSITLMAMGLASLGGFSLRRRRKDEQQKQEV